MNVLRALAGLLCLNRIGFGVAYLARPAASGRSWIGRIAQVSPTQVFIRGHGARDVALGAGGLAALAGRDDAQARRWLAAAAVTDAADVAATLAAGRRLPREGRRFALAMAGGSTAIAAASAALLGRASAR